MFRFRHVVLTVKLKDRFFTRAEIFAENGSNSPPSFCIFEKKIRHCLDKPIPCRQNSHDGSRVMDDPEGGSESDARLPPSSLRVTWSR